MRAVGIIPARFKSTRFPGKPLVNLLGKPMIIYVCEIAEKALGRSNTYVATDSVEIQQVVESHGYNVIMTSESCLTGTDRLAEAIDKIGQVDIVINIQGDEPLVKAESIQKVLAEKEQTPELIINGMARIGGKEDPASRNIPKVVVTEDRRLLYMSRALLPASKAEGVWPSEIWKQVCIYAFSPGQLKAFSDFGRKSYNESYEDIEILRFLDLGYSVKMVELPDDSLAVDAPEDVRNVENVLKAR